jgi:hypothetical protein
MRVTMTHGTDEGRTHGVGITLAILVTSLVASGASGCSRNDPVYFPAPETLEVDGMGTGAKGTVALRFRAPSADEEQQRQALGAQLGYQVPWLREDRVHVEVRYTITNLGDREGMFSLLIEGATEFTRFDSDAIAAVFMAGNQDAPAVSLIEVPNPPILGPGQVYQGVVREDDFHEASLDLDAMGRFMAPFVSVLLNRSEVNPIGLDMVPRNLIRSALWEITLRFNANQHMACQFLVRVRDDDQVLWEDGNSDFAPNPAAFTPVVMP